MKARRARISNRFVSPQDNWWDIYSEHGVDELFDDDELTSVEEGFLKGYLTG